MERDARGGIRSESITFAIDPALRGDRAPLYASLVRSSGLPGPRANVKLAQAFGDVLAARGEEGEPLAVTLATLDADEAPGASELEFLPMCGVLALASRAALEPRERPRILTLLHDRADDLRFRVREAVTLGLVRIGQRAGDSLVVDVAPWMDGLFHAAAVLTALAAPAWMDTLQEERPVLARLDEAFALADGAPRASARSPGYKALLEALSVTPGVAGSRFGAPVFDMMVAWAKTKEPAIRDAVRKNVENGKNGKMRGRHAEAVERVLAAFRATAPVPRDPTLIVQGTRKRGGGRRRGPR